MRNLLPFSLLFLVIISIKSFAQNDIEIVNKTVDPDEAAGHIWFLASDELKGRNTGSEEIDIAASYIATRFKSYGVKPLEDLGSYYQIINLYSVKPPSSSSFTAGKFNFEIGNNLLAIQAAKIDKTADIFFDEYALPDKLNGKDLAGMIVVAQAGNGEEGNPRQLFRLSEEKREAVKNAGAIGLIEIFNSNSLPWTRLMSFMNREQISQEEPGNEPSFPNAWIYDPEGEFYTFIKESATQKGELKMEAAEKKAKANETDD